MNLFNEVDELELFEKNLDNFIKQQNIDDSYLINFNESHLAGWKQFYAL